MTALEATLAQTIICTVLSLELADETLISPDYSVCLMESIAAELEALSREQKVLLCERMQEMSTTARADEARILSELPASLGIAS